MSIINNKVKNSVICITHPKFDEELNRFIKQSCDRQQIMVSFNRYKELIIKCGSVPHHKHIEKLKDVENLYAMRIITTNSNLRILFSLCEGPQLVFLVLFFEKQGKKKSEYINYIPIAIKRRDDIYENYIG